MKKVIYTILMALATSLLMAGCASIPEPTEKYTTLVYGMGEYNGSYEFAGTESAETVTKYSGIKIVLRNAKTRNKYTFISNSRGEFLKAGLPEGTYQLIEVSTEYTYDDATWKTSIAPYNISGEEFTLSQGVLNLGKIYITVDFTNGNGSLNLVRDYNLVRNSFEQKYPDSQWNYQHWTTMN